MGLLGDLQSLHLIPEGQELVVSYLASLFNKIPEEKLKDEIVIQQWKKKVVCVIMENMRKSHHVAKIIPPVNMEWLEKSVSKYIDTLMFFKKKLGGNNLNLRMVEDYVNNNPNYKFFEAKEALEELTT